MGGGLSPTLPLEECVMKCKKVIDGCRQKYDIEEITILEGHRVHYSGSFDKFYTICDVDMLLYRDQLLKREVEAKTVFNHRKLFLFLACNNESAEV